MIEKKLLEILACPQCKGELNYKKDKQVLICYNCELIYEIKDDIPILLIEESKTLKENEK